MRRRTHPTLLILAAALVLAIPLAAGRAVADPSQRLVLDPEASHVDFVLGATLHSVEGSLRLVNGEILFEPDGGAAAGRVVVDARSADTGSDRRDRNMHGEVLESERFPQIVFLPEQLAVERVSADEAHVELVGTVEIHGVRKPLAIPATVQREGEQIHIRGDFSVPYVEWGMKDYSNFVLRVAPTVDVSLDLIARAEPGEAAPPGQGALLGR